MQPVDGCTGLEGKRKANGVPAWCAHSLTNFCVLNNLKITNSVLRCKDIHK
jgi:hypothetical protein